MSKRLTPEQDLERLLDDDAGEFGGIYARLARPQPPRRLDRVVLANAARAVHGGRAPRAQRWALAMGSVTGVVLAAGIAWQVGQQMESRDSVPDGSQRMQDSRVVPVEAISEPRPRKKAKADLIMRDPERSAETRQIAEVEEELASKPNAPAAPPSPNVPAAPAVARPSATSARESSGKSAGSSASAAASDRMEAEAFPAEPGAAAHDSGQLRESNLAKTRKSSSTAAERSAIMESRSAADEPGPSAASASPAKALSNRNEQLTQEAWLDEIERLLDVGRRDEAVENLRAFRARYPDWPIPDALRQLEP